MKRVGLQKPDISLRLLRSLTNMESRPSLTVIERNKPVTDLKPNESAETVNEDEQRPTKRSCIEKKKRLT